jgi:hypothetical protein
MTNFYAYIGEREPVGGDRRFIWRDLKNVGAARRRLARLAKGQPCRLFTFTNFYDDSTFREV